MIFQSQLKRLVNLAFSPRYLLATNTTIGLGALVSADFVQQLAGHYLYSPKQDQPQASDDQLKMVDNGYVHDTRRTLSMTAGGLFIGIGGHYWYGYLDKRFSGKSFHSISRKLLCEAIIGPPLVSLCFYMVARSEGKSTAEWYESFKKTIVTITLVDWGYFIPLQAINFYLLPPKYRLLFVAGITFIYDNFLSYIFHQ